MANMANGNDVLNGIIRERKDKEMSTLPDLPTIKISKKEKADFYSKFGKSAAMLQCLNLYDEINRLTKLLIVTENDSEINRISKKLETFNKIVGLYKNASDTVNKMQVRVVEDNSKEEDIEGGGEGIEITGIDIKIER